MPDPTPPAEPERGGSPGFSPYDYRSPGDYRAPDFVSQWAATGSEPVPDAERTRSEPALDAKRPPPPELVAAPEPRVTSGPLKPSPSLAKPARSETQTAAARSAPNAAPVAAPAPTRKRGGALIAAGIVSAILAVVFAGADALPATLVLLAGAAGCAIVLFRPTFRRRVSASIILVIALLSAIIQVAQIGSNLEAGAGAAGPEATLSLAGTSTYSGTGDQRLSVELAGGQGQFGLLRVQADGGDIAVYSVDAEGEQGVSIFYEYSSEAVDEQVVFNEYADDDFAGLEVEAEGAWTITLEDVATVPSFDSEVSGSGAQIVLYTGSGGEGSIELPTDGSIAVETYGEDIWGASVYSARSITRTWEPGPTLIHMDPADGSSWTIRIGAPLAT